MPAEAATGAYMNDKKYKILVVDDDPDIREIVASFLSLEGHLCHVAKDGAEARDKTHNDHFDALITDFRMPRMNGITLAGEILKHDKSFPVIIMTGSIDEVSAESIVSVGASDFLYKPFTIVELGARFTRMMRIHESIQSSPFSGESGSPGAC
jgi:DNA-binding response OmpR family regulator